MIQRKQSLYLLLVVISCVTVNFTDIVYRVPLDAGSAPYAMDIHGVYQTTGGVKGYLYSTFFSFTLNFVILLWTAICIFNFKNRIKQIKLCSMLLLFEVAYIVWVFYQCDTIFPEAAKNYKAIYWLGAYLPVINLLLIILARMAVKKDEELVRSADRIR